MARITTPAMQHDYRAFRMHSGAGERLVWRDVEGGPRPPPTPPPTHVLAAAGAAGGTFKDVLRTIMVEHGTGSKDTPCKDKYPEIAATAGHMIEKLRELNGMDRRLFRTMMKIWVEDTWDEQDDELAQQPVKRARTEKDKR